MRNTVATLAFGLFVSVVACGEVDPYGDLGEISTDAKATEGSGDGATCSAAIAGVEPSTLTACTGTKGSKGRCVPKATLATFADTFETAGCKGSEACVPEELVKKGSNIELKKCNAVLNSEGRCFWPLAKEVIANYDLLKSATKDQCEGDQICAPCAHPVTKAETGVCKLGGGGGDCKGGSDSKGGSTGPAAPAAKCPQVEPLLEESAFKQEDCSSNMLCVDPALAGALASKLAKCKTGVCAPKKSVLRGGNYVPKTCKSTAGAEGRCANVGVPQIGEQKDKLPQADCDADERCAPCFDPRDGKETGACSQASCDKPKEPAKVLAQCCGGKGRCVSASLAGESAESLGTDSCSGETPLCAPNEFVGTATPRPCGALFGISKGVCLSRCAVTKGGMLQGIIKGDCDDGEFCAPCGQVPPGTPGCAAN